MRERSLRLDGPAGREADLDVEVDRTPLLPGQLEGLRAGRRGSGVRGDLEVEGRPQLHLGRDARLRIGDEVCGPIKAEEIAQPA